MPRARPGLPPVLALCGVLLFGCATGTTTGEEPVTDDVPFVKPPPLDVADDFKAEDVPPDGVSEDAGDAPDARDVTPVIDLMLPRDVPVTPPNDTSTRCPAGACVPGMVRPCGRCGVQRCFAPCDWGTCASEGECAPAATRACGGCGTQTCTSACAWGTCQGGGGTCTPGQTRACGNCGTQTCTSACAWGTCSNEGACAPGQTRATGCDRCSQQTCGSNCQWGGCALRPGGACEHRNGTNSRACGACRCGRQWCLDTCQWSTSCTSCCSTCGGCLAP